MSDDTGMCQGSTESHDGSNGLRVGSIFIILVTSLFSSLFPVVTKRVPACKIPDWIYNILRYFGSGVILATAFMHLLQPAAEELGSPCLSSTFQEYPFAFLFALFSGLLTFLMEMMTLRVGARLAKSLADDPHQSNHHPPMELQGDPHDMDLLPSPDSHLNLTDEVKQEVSSNNQDLEKAPATADPPCTSSATEVRQEAGQITADSQQILGCFVLEFGILLHSFIIGLTLGSTSGGSDFNILFVVIIFHQMFEGLGLGVRLAYLPLHSKQWIPFAAALVYPCITPLGVAIGIGVRHSYNGNSAVANYVEGTLDAISSGILTYSGFVELLAHDFVFNDKMHQIPIWELGLNIFCLFAGAGVMSLLAKWG